MSDTPPEPFNIQAIDKASVHRICSGQVVLTLATAVKELVENSIDAGATSVDVKLKEYGSESIEVGDNGCGVEEKNFSGLTLKHHTSKIADFSDVATVETFGFRGEALSSLCALSNMSVVTCHKSQSVGTKLEFNQHGTITCKTPSPRQTGTTVVLQNLFYTLPVRHKEFHRNLKKEFAKMVQVLNAYCLITTGARITCTNQVGKGNRSVVVSTKGNSTIKENIANIFGPKQVQSLLEFKQTEASEEVCSWFGVKPRNNGEQLFRIEGFVSKCEHGQGRSSSDRQFVFINKRPCDSSKILRLINEVYHSYNRHQHPFVVLHITMAKESVDVNVTPDKRQIFMQEEKLLLATLKTSLVKLYEPTTSCLRINQVESTVKRGEDLSTQEPRGLIHRSNSEPNTQQSSSGMLSRLKRSYLSAFDKQEHTNNTESPKERKIDSWVLSKHHSLPTSKPESSIKMFFKSSTPQKHFSYSEEQNPVSISCSKEGSSVSIDITTSTSIGSDLVTSSLSNHVISDYDDSRTSSSSQNDMKCIEEKSPTLSESSGFGSVSPEFNSKVAAVGLVCPEFSSKVATVGYSGDEARFNEIVSCKSDQESVLSSQESVPLSDVFSQESVPPCDLSSQELVPSCNVSSQESIPSQSSSISDVQKDASCSVSSHHTDNTDGFHEESASSFTMCSRPEMENHPVLCVSPSDSGALGGEEMTNRTNDGSSVKSLISVAECDVTVCQKYDEKLDCIKKEKTISFSLHDLKQRRSQKVQNEGKSEFCRSFRAQIVATDNKAAEDELQKEITKDMFQDMDIVGQFNLGFIIAKSGDDLFIVDQHASDEKFNFEMLQRHTVIDSQKLICPQNLELTASNEAILVDNLEIFKKNGFDFLIDDTAEPTKRVKLLSTPISKNWHFGKEDIEELVFMLTDSPGVMCRPSRVRQMFASRACRKSIMVGTALKNSQMKKLLCHMGEIEQPWNCPHGRPTMRHLINLNMLPR
ncbi:mismatch repair endonuclease PMS2-like isoform X2 [Gigantopelta aegis]|nr:mismatch repair endonuclease PMS2-like isoform X2 [Gigantopelta aegis]